MENKRTPGDGILDRYLPNADALAREQARERLFAFARALLNIAMRTAREDLGGGDSRELPKGAKMNEAP